MAKKNYYKILGVSQTATPEELSAAKNLLAKQYHPDVNMKKGIDTTKQMQLILEAYRVLSDPDKRAAYDTKLFGKKSAKKKRSFNIYNMEETPFPEEVSFVTYWRVADSLYEITQESNRLFKERTHAYRLSQLADQAIHYTFVLKDAQIPARYWHPEIMNWLLFTWNKNRNLPISYLLTLYDDYVKTDLNTLKRLKLKREAKHFQHSVKRLVNF